MAITLQSIFQQHFTRFAAGRRLSGDMHRAAWSIIHCRTRELGGHVNSCPDGHYHQIAYNSCRHRCCPQCGWLPKTQWLDGWRKRLLPCPHHHVIFTLPHELNEIWRHNKAAFADTLFAAASQTLSELLGDAKFLGGRVGILAALHTWNQELQEHIHLHTIVTAGDGTWRKPCKPCLLPRKVLMIKFRGKFKAMLREKLYARKLKLPRAMSVEDFEDLLRQLTSGAWNVKVYDAYRDGASVATYLARYIKGGPIGNSRLLPALRQATEQSPRVHGWSWAIDRSLAATRDDESERYCRRQDRMSQTRIDVFMDQRNVTDMTERPRGGQHCDVRASVKSAERRQEFSGVVAELVKCFVI